MSRLIGSPPGYVGYDDQDCLVTPLRQRPGRVVLLEAFDKAHETIQDRLLKVMEDGEIVDTHGHRGDASHAIFVLTLHRAADQGRKGSIGFGDRRDEEKEQGAWVSGDQAMELEARLRSGVDVVIPFKSLAADPKSGSLAVLEQGLARLCANLRREYGVELEIEESLHRGLEAKVSHLSTVNAIDEVLDREVLRPLVSYLLGGEEEKALRLAWSEDHLVVEKAAVSD